MIEQVSSLLNADPINEGANFNLLEDAVAVIQEQNRNKKTALELVLYYLVHRDNEWEYIQITQNTNRNSSLRS